MRVLVDTGPLVAILSQDDQYHELCVQTLKELPAPLFTCWPVITEAAWLLREHPPATERLLRSLSAGFLRLLPVEGTEAGIVADIMMRYADLRPQLADATLVHLAIREIIGTIFTLDRRDFSVYRGVRRKPFRIVPEFGSVRGLRRG
jgi:predicted nucleic acid-binding protein